jgi:polyhydroxyalkanoate synthesis regulator phasin
MNTKNIDDLLEIGELNTQSIIVITNVLEEFRAKIEAQGKTIEKLEGDVAKLKNKTGCYP